MATEVESVDAVSGFSQGQENAVVRLAQACASLSFVGSLIIIVTRLRSFKQLRTYSFELAVWLAVCDIIVNFTYLLGSPTDGSVLCYCQAALQHFFQIAMIQWTVLISQSLLVVASRTRIFDGSKRMPWNHVWAWGVAGVMTLGPASTRSFGRAECTFCWITTGGVWAAGEIWRAMFIALVFISMVAIVWAYVAVVVRLGHAQRDIVLLSSDAARGGSWYMPQGAVVETSPKSARSIASSRPQELASAQSSASPSPRVRVKWASQTSILGRGTDDDCTGAGDNIVGKLGNKTVDASAVARRHSLRSKVFGSGVLFTSERRAFEPTERPKSMPEPGQSAIAWGGRAQGRQSLIWRLLGRDPPGDGRGSRQLSATSTELSRRSSMLSISRTNSQVSSKEWLWSISREAGFLEDKGVHEDDRDDRANALFSNVSASRPPQSPLPPLAESEAGVGSPSGARIATGVEPPDCTSSLSLPAVEIRPHLRRARSETYTAPAPERIAAVMQHETAARADVAVNRESATDTGNASTAEHPLTMVPALDPETGGGGASVIPFIGSDRVTTTARRPLRTRLADGAGKVRVFVRRMSSIDIAPDRAILKLKSTVVSSKNSSEGDGVGAGRGSTLLARPTGRARSRARTGDMDKFVTRVKWYPVIYVLCWVFTLASGIHTFVVGDGRTNFTLMMLAVSTSRLQGLLNFVWYGLNHSLKEAWLQDFLYRRAVASCCRAVLCCCSSPCFPRAGDEEDPHALAVVAFHEVEFSRDTSQPGAKESAAATLEESGASSTAASPQSPPSNISPGVSGRPLPPSTPDAQAVSHISTPHRPARPGRRACELKNAKRRGRPAHGVGCFLAVSGDQAHGHPRDVKRPTRQVLGHTAAGRLSKPTCLAGSPVDAAPGGAMRQAGDRDKRSRPILSPALPITVNIPIRVTSVPSVASLSHAEEGSSCSESDSSLRDDTSSIFGATSTDSDSDEFDDASGTDDDGSPPERYESGDRR